MPQSDFKNSPEYAFRRLIRAVISKNLDLTATQRLILRKMCDDWFYHKSGPKGFIHPGRKRLAKHACCKIVTVARALDKFRKLGLIRVVGHSHGQGQKPTEYIINEGRILEYCGIEIPETITGTLVRFPQNDTPNDTPLAYQNDTQSKRSKTLVEKKLGNGGVI
jgi:hypothetical protein